MPISLRCASVPSIGSIASRLTGVCVPAHLVNSSGVSSHPTRLEMSNPSPALLLFKYWTSCVPRRTLGGSVAVTGRSCAFDPAPRIGEILAHEASVAGELKCGRGEGFSVWVGKTRGGENAPIWLTQPPRQKLKVSPRCTACQINQSYTSLYSKCHLRRNVCLIPSFYL